MLDVLTASDVRRQDAACEALGIGVEELMERAGFAVARAVRALLGTTYGTRVVVVAGTGNNGGDGLVAGRLLAAWGAHVTAVFPLGEPSAGAAAAQRRRFPGRVAAPGALARELERADLIVDALFGVGLSRAPAGPAAAAIEAMNASAAPMVSVDVPSGMDADTGASPGPVAAASGVVALGGLKPGLLFGSPDVSWVEVADIGVPDEERRGAAVALEAGDVRALLPVRDASANKRGCGVVLVVAGSRAMPGAAALTAGAAVHAGAGLTTLAGSDRVTSIALSRVPEMTTIPLPETAEGTLDEKGVEAILARKDEFDAIAVGPGLSRHPAVVDAVRALVLQTRAPLVLDADGINAFEGAAEMLAQRDGFLVVTPHEGECARLLGRPSAAIRADRLGAARAAAERTGHAVLLKGPGTIVTDPRGATFLNTTGNRGLAQGGTGDVLTGMIAAMLAQGGAGAGDDERLALVACAAWLHGRAGDLASDRVAPHPANASMLVDLLPETIHGVFEAS